MVPFQGQGLILFVPFCGTNPKNKKNLLQVLGRAIAADTTLSVVRASGSTADQVGLKLQGVCTDATSTDGGGGARVGDTDVVPRSNDWAGDFLQLEGTATKADTQGMLMPPALPADGGLEQPGRCLVPAYQYKVYCIINACVC